MGFSVSAATVILFLAFIAGGLALTSALEGAGEARNAGVDAEEERILDRVNTQINVTGAVYNGTGDTLRVSIANTGSSTLDTGDTDLLVDGQFERPATVAVAGDTGRDLWTPGTRATLTVDSLTQQPDRVKVVTGPGVAAVRTNVTSA
jgi:flagellar protein FlaF